MEKVYCNTCNNFIAHTNADVSYGDFYCSDECKMNYDKIERTYCDDDIVTYMVVKTNYEGEISRETITMTYKEYREKYL